MTPIEHSIRSNDISTKKCSNCHVHKNISEFGKDKQKSDGLNPRCKTCWSIIKKKAYRGKNGLIHNIYKNQKQNSIFRGYQPPKYTVEELISWCSINESFNTIYDNWVASNYDNNLAPSLDRISDYGIYEFSNIQVVTWKENRDKSHKDRKEGRNTKNSKAVIQYDRQGNKLNEYFSINEASRQLNIGTSNIINNCVGKRKSAGGFIWQYA